MSRKSIESMTAVQSRGAFPMLIAFVRAYPGRSAAAMLSVFVAGLLDGLGMSMLLSMLSLATGQSKKDPSLPERFALNVADFFHVAPTAPNLLGLAILLISLKAAMSLFANRQVGYTVAYIATELRLALIRAVLKSNWRHYLQQSVGRLSNAVATEAQRAADAFQNGAEMAAMFLNALIYLGVALSISIEAGVVAGGAGLVLLLLMSRLIRGARRAGQHQTDLLSSLLAVISGQLSAAKPLKAMAREEHVDALLSDQTRKLKGALRRQVISKEALTALQEPLLAMMVGAGFFMSLVWLKMPLASVIVMLFMLARVVSYLSKSQRAYQQVAMRESAYWSIVQAIDAAREHSEPPGGDRVVPLARELRFDDVLYSHHGSQPIINRQSLSIPAYQMTLIVGPSGAGKTTVLDLVVGLLTPQAGQILIDDVPLAEMNLREWRRQIGYVPQESVMVNESVAYNLTLGEDIAEDEIREALRAADALGFVDAMPEGIRTLVGENGSRLSGGQRQRLAIARALIHKPRLLILDEATSSLDAEAQSAVIETVQHLKGKLTILAVAHQGVLIDAADRIYRLTAGELRLVPDEARGRKHG